jgi:hypothetical protein
VTRAIIAARRVAAARCLTAACIITLCGIGSTPVSAAQDGDAASPRYATSAGLTLISSGAPIRDAFDAPAIDETSWRIWRSDPERLETFQKDGRYWIRIRGAAGYNGLVSRATMQTRDVVAVCRAGVRSEEGARHAAIIHLCGSGKESPDHWYEIGLNAGPKGSVRVAATVSVPERNRAGYRGGYDLPAPADGEGYLIKIACDGASHRCTGFARVGAEWWQIGDPFEVPARTTRLEVKTSGTESGPGGSTIWFDDCRVYSRPETHYVTVRLRTTADGSPGIDSAAGRNACRDADGREIPDCAFTVELRTADGATLIDASDTGAGFGYALLRLDRAPWDLYPVAAILRVLANGRQIGPDHVIATRGVEGLYPDDVYAITVR